MLRLWQWHLNQDGEDFLYFTLYSTFRFKLPKVLTCSCVAFKSIYNVAPPTILKKWNKMKPDSIPSESHPIPQNCTVLSSFNAFVQFPLPWTALFPTFLLLKSCPFIKAHIDSFHGAFLMILSENNAVLPYDLITPRYINVYKTYNILLWGKMYCTSSKLRVTWTWCHTITHLVPYI